MNNQLPPFDDQNKEYNRIDKNSMEQTEKRVLSLFSGCGGMDIGFEGGFLCRKRSINQALHPDWIQKDL